jgi:murein DD-endopeptidase MepM/ murein hydrolase activator NlpD
MRLFRREAGWLFGGLCSVALGASLVAVGYYHHALEWTERELAALSRETLARTAADAERSARSHVLAEQLLIRVAETAAERDRVSRTAEAQERTVDRQRQRIERLSAEGERLAAERDRLIAENESAVAAVTAERVALVEHAAAEQARLLTDRETVLEDAVAERERLADERDRAFVELDATMNETRWALRELDAQTRSAVADVERIILAAGLEPARLAPEPNRLRRVGARGGPYIPWKAQVTQADQAEAAQVRALTQQVERLKTLRDVMVRLPLIAPVTHAILSDGFGYRRDPVNGGGARHEGLDLRAVRDSAIIAPAAGTVVAAGWDGAFGNLIQIDHGFGVVSRYAHLSRMLVRKGDVVAPREQIGVVGATGRVTGTHLHYEIWIDGRPRDPLRFIGATSGAFSGFSRQ